MNNVKKLACGCRTFDDGIRKYRLYCDTHGDEGDFGY